MPPRDNKPRVVSSANTRTIEETVVSVIKDMDCWEAGRLVRAVVRKSLVRDYEVPPMFQMPGDPYKPSSPIDVDDDIEASPRAKMKSMVADAKFLGHMEAFC